MNLKKIHQGKQIIFIVEDNEIYGKSLQAFIQARFPDVKEIQIFHIGEMCLMELHRNPAIVIVDYFLNSKYEEAHNGLEIIKQIKSQKPKTNVIVLSSQEKPGVILESIRDHDCRYVQKDNDSFQHIETLIKEFLTPKSPATLEPWA